AVALAAGHLGGGEPQGRSGLFDVQLEGGALVALLVRELVLLELADDDHAVTLLMRLGEVLAVLPPQRAAQERRFTIARNDRYFDKDSEEWVDGDPTFLRCSLWREMVNDATAIFFLVCRSSG